MSKKLIIEIEDKDYERACKATMSFDGAMHIYQAIKESTPYNPSGDAISREALKKAIKDNGYSHYFEIFDIIDNAPPVPQVTVFTETADEKAVADLKAELQNVVEARPQNNWIKIFENPFTNGYVCPFCGHKIQVTEQFLPEVTECESCGAEMKGGAE